MDLDAERLRAALRRHRIGRVTSSKRDINHTLTCQTPSADSVHIEATVPAWLINSLEREDGPPRSKLSVFSASQDDELWALLWVERGTAQLCLVLPLDDSGAQQFLRQGLRGGALALSLESEEKERSATVYLGLPLADAAALERLLQRARSLPGALTRLAHFVEARSCGTLMSGVRADSRNGVEVVVLVSNQAHALTMTPEGQLSLGFYTS